jgi:conflict system STAND superfamily ATPase
MPRQERPLESEETPLLRFAGDLRRLRRRAGLPTYRELGRRTNYSAAALSETVAGRRLPSLAITLAFVRACDGDVGEWTGRWRQLAAAHPGAGDEVAAPYVGLASYQVSDADRFFGREALTGTLLALVDERPFVGVFGASGAGKSSLLRAGLAARTGRAALVITPGSDPVTELAVAVSGLANDPVDRVRDDLAAGPEALRGWLAKAADDLLLVVDQFEEVFTLCDEATRSWLVRALTSAAGPRSRIVVGVRADFYAHCARHPELVTALYQAQLLVGPMSGDDLRRAITEPAGRAGASLETALVTRLVSDVAGQPAALPLASHALAETWRRRRGMVLTLTGYQDAGGIENALARTAERTFEQLGEDDRATARLLFLRLVAPGDGTEDTKRRVRRSDLDITGPLLDRLAAARLIMIDRDSVELAHEALLHAWPRLAGWIDQGRDDLRAQHRITEAAAVWEALQGDPDTLYRGARLEQAARLRDRLTPRELRFLDAGVTAELGRAVSARRATRRLHRLVAGLAALAVLLAGAVVVAVVARRTADRQRDEALSIRAADTARDLVKSKPGDAAALALAAYRVSPTTQARDILVLAHAAANAGTLGSGYVTPPGRIAITWEPRALASTSGERLWRRDGTGWRPAAGLPTGTSFLYLMSADDRRAFYWNGSASTVWDLSDPDHPVNVPVPAGLPLADSADRTGSVVAAIRTDRTAVVWRVRERTVRRLPPPGVDGAAVLPDGSGVVLGRNNGTEHTLERWTLGGTKVATLLRAPYPMYPHAGPAGLVVATSTSGGVTVLDTSDPGAGRVVARAGDLADPALVAFDPAGRTVAVTDPGNVRLWDTTTGAALLSLHTKGLQLNLPRVDGPRVSVLDENSAMWSLDSDLGRVIRETCAGPVALDWKQYFPGTGRRRLCS